MKNMVRRFSALAMALLLCCSLNVAAFAVDESDLAIEPAVVDVDVQSLVYEYAETVSNADVDKYIDLFTEDNQSSMLEYVNEFGTEEFFREESIEITNLTALSTDTGRKSAGLSQDELSEYENIVVYYAELIIDDTQKEYKTFILVDEDGGWKILRVSTPDLRVISESEESFGTYTESEQMNEQENQKNALLETSLISTIAAPDADPTEITVYFQKAANRNHYGDVRKTLDWNTYLKNVIPKEWTVSYYDSYPEYLRAGTMASKMYAWWYIVHPKWDYSPYYADVQDNSKDQNFLYSAYDDMEFDMYRDDVDEVISWVRNIAMCDDEGNMFEVHYHATNGTQYSGQLSASGALRLAKNGKSMLQILKYYYDYSSYIGKNHTVELWAYV